MKKSKLIVNKIAIIAIAIILASPLMLFVWCPTNLAPLSVWMNLINVLTVIILIWVSSQWMLSVYVKYLLKRVKLFYDLPKILKVFPLCRKLVEEVADVLVYEFAGGPGIAEYEDVLYCCSKKERPDLLVALEQRISERSYEILTKLSLPSNLSVSEKENVSGWLSSRMDMMENEEIISEFDPKGKSLAYKALKKELILRISENAIPNYMSKLIVSLGKRGVKGGDRSKIVKSLKAEAQSLEYEKLVTDGKVKELRKKGL